MPYCPTCETEYRAGFTHCADCGRLLAEQRPPRHPNPKPPVGEPVVEVQVSSYPTRGEAEMWARFLETAGIPSLVRPIGPGNEIPGTELLWPHILLVRAQDESRARELLQG